MSAPSSPLSDETDVLQVIPLKGMRGAIAHAMTQSLQVAAQLTLHRSFDPSPVMDYKRGLDSEQRPTVNDLMLCAVARVLVEHPAVNATVQDDAVTRWRRVHLGMAVATDRGLVVPVVRDAHVRSVSQLSEEAARLVDL